MSNPTVAILEIRGTDDDRANFKSKLEFDPPLDMNMDVNDAPVSHIVLLQLHKRLQEMFTPTGEPSMTLADDENPTIQH